MISRKMQVILRERACGLLRTLAYARTLAGREVFSDAHVVRKRFDVFASADAKSAMLSALVHSVIASRAAA